MDQRVIKGNNKMTVSDYFSESGRKNGGMMRSRCDLRNSNNNISTISSATEGRDRRYYYG